MGTLWNTARREKEIFLAYMALIRMATTQLHKVLEEKLHDFPSQEPLPIAQIMLKKQFSRTPFLGTEKKIYHHNLSNATKLAIESSLRTVQHER